MVQHVLGQITRQQARAEREEKVASSSRVNLPVYRDRAQKKWSVIDPSALAAPGTVDADMTIRLTDVFVPQLARRSRPSVSLPRDYLERQGLNPAVEAAHAEQIAATWERTAAVPALQLVAECRERHLVLAILAQANQPLPGSWYCGCSVQKLRPYRRCPLSQVIYLS